MERASATKPASRESSDCAYDLEGIRAEIDAVSARLDAIQAMVAGREPPADKNNVRNA